MRATAPPAGRQAAENAADAADIDARADRRRRFEELFATHAAVVYAYARRRTTPVDAEEVVADTFLAAWRRLDAIPPDAALPWLLAVARRTLANRYRGDARRGALQRRLTTYADAGRALIDCGTDSDADTDRIRAALATLPPAEYEALTLLAWDELSPDEIATVVGCTRAAVYLRLSRARRRLRAALAPGQEKPS